MGIKQLYSSSKDGFVVAHPSDKNKDVARVGHPARMGPRHCFIEARIEVEVGRELLACIKAVRRSS
jgi:hypothetical protein